MQEPKIPTDEIQRINALHDLEILDTPPEERFDRITKIAQLIFDVPIALVSLVDTNRQWFKSCAGLSAKETPRSLSFCGHAIFNEDILAIEDAKLDDRFADNPLVTGEPFIRFYAGRPIHSPNNLKLGTLCIIDKVPRKLSKADKKLLNDLAIWVENEFKNIKLTKELKIANKELLKKDHQKEEFSAMISHELKTPLTPITMWCDALLEPDLMGPLNKEQKEAIQKITSNADSLLSLINDIFDVQKLDMKKLVLTSEEIKLKEFMQELYENNLNLAKEKKIKLINSTQGQVTIKNDRKRLSQILNNFIKNALDFVPENSGMIEMNAKETENSITFFVKDNGVGIDKEQQPNLFKKFYQVDTSFTRKHGGSGLGLAISKSLVDAMGGSIWVESEKGKGSTFSFKIPKEFQLTPHPK